MAIANNDALFNLVGTTYGGDGQATFAIPDLRGRIPIHAGTARDGVTYVLGQNLGLERVALTTQQLPAHSHAMSATTTGQVRSPITATVLATPAGGPPGTVTFVGQTAAQPLAPSLTAAGGNQPHSNLQPFLCVNFIISLFGLYPTPT